MRKVRVTWGRVAQPWFVDEPGKPNVVAWRRFEIRLWLGARSLPVWRWRRRWAARTPEQADAALYPN